MSQKLFFFNKSLYSATQPNPHLKIKLNQKGPLIKRASKIKLEISHSDNHKRIFVKELQSYSTMIGKLTPPKRTGVNQLNRKVMENLANNPPLRFIREGMTTPKFSEGFVPGYLKKRIPNV